MSLCSFALANADAGVVFRDPALQIYREITPRIRQYLLFIDGCSVPDADAGLAERIRHAAKFLDVQLLYAGRGSAKRNAAFISGSDKKTNPVNFIIKQSMRVLCGIANWVRWLWAAFRGVLPSADVKEPQSTEARPVVLVAFVFGRSKKLDGTLARSRLHAAHIIHDLIPVCQAELVSPSFTFDMQRFLRRVLTRPEPVVAISSATKHELLRWNANVAKAEYPFPIPVVPLGNVFATGNLTAQPIAALVGRNFAVYCSTFDVRKRQDLLAKVWARMVSAGVGEALPDLVLIGFKGSGWSALCAALEASGPARSSIHVLTDVSDAQLAWAYRHAAFGLFPSISEGWGLGVTECLANGLPVIHCDIPVLKEASQGLMPVAAPDDEDAWVRAVDDVVRDPAKLEALRAIIQKSYVHNPPDEFARSVCEYLKTVAAGESSGTAAPVT
jgi:glycosyltransferase involved in cell wall biosynthesis